MNVGKSLKMALAKRDLKQNELAQRMGYTRQWISHVANSRTAHIQTIEKLCAALGFTVSEFIALAED